MEKYHLVISEMRQKWVARVQKRASEQRIHDDKEECRGFTAKEVEEKLDLYSDLLVVTDTLFSHFRIMKPTEVEVERAIRCLKCFCLIWDKLLFLQWNQY